MGTTKTLYLKHFGNRGLANVDICIPMPRGAGSGPTGGSIAGIGEGNPIGRNRCDAFRVRASCQPLATGCFGITT
jgi:hypothetical protein